MRIDNGDVSGIQEGRERQGEKREGKGLGELLFQRLGTEKVFPSSTTLVLPPCLPSADQLFGIGAFSHHCKEEPRETCGSEARKRSFAWHVAANCEGSSEALEFSTLRPPADSSSTDLNGGAFTNHLAPAASSRRTRGLLLFKGSLSTTKRFNADAPCRGRFSRKRGEAWSQEVHLTQRRSTGALLLKESSRVAGCNDVPEESRAATARNQGAR